MKCRRYCSDSSTAIVDIGASATQPSSKISTQHGNGGERARGAAEAKWDCALFVHSDWKNLPMPQAKPQANSVRHLI